MKRVPADSVLARIVEQKKREVVARRAACPLAELQRQVLASERSFCQALSRPGLSLIAELKKASPSRGLLRPDFDAASVAAIYDRHAQAISVLLDETFFQGGLSYLAQARQASTKPLLGKEFIIDEYQVWEARAHGADAVLLMSSLLEAQEIEELLQLLRCLRMDALVEVHDVEEVQQVLKTSARVIGVNNRDLKTLRIDEEQFSRLAPHLRRGKPDCLLVAESGVSQPAQLEQLRECADAVLIGTALMLADDIEVKIEELGW